MSACDAKIRPITFPLEVECEIDGPHNEHEGVIRDFAYPGSSTTISWLENDRRTFRGEWHPCLSPGCVLPAEHRGGHTT